MISYSIAFSALRKNLCVIRCRNNGLLTKYMVKVQSWKMSSNLARLAANPCRMEGALPAGCLSLRPLYNHRLPQEALIAARRTWGHSFGILSLQSVSQAEKELLENGLLKIDSFESALEGTDCEFCLQHPIFGFFFFL